MKWTVLVRVEAERDLAGARDWYEEKRAGLGEEFLDEFATVARELERQPTRGRPYYGNFRRALLRRFPYKVFYQLIEGRVVVFRVLHARQDHPRRMG